jgi:hypothetical protein
VLGRDRSYFATKKHPDSTKKFSEIHIINIHEFLIDDIFVMSGGCVFQQVVGIHMCTTSSRRLVPLFVWGRLHTGVSQEKQKEPSQIL